MQAKLIEYLDKKIVQLNNANDIRRNKLEKQRATKKYIEKLISDKKRSEAVLRRVNAQLREIAASILRND